MSEEIIQKHLTRKHTKGTVSQPAVFLYIDECPTTPTGTEAKKLVHRCFDSTFDFRSDLLLLHNFLSQKKTPED